MTPDFVYTEDGNNYLVEVAAQRTLLKGSAQPIKSTQMVRVAGVKPQPIHQQVGESTYSRGIPFWPGPRQHRFFKIITRDSQICSVIPTDLQFFIQSSSRFGT